MKPSICTTDVFCRCTVRVLNFHGLLVGRRAGHSSLAFCVYAWISSDLSASRRRLQWGQGRRLQNRWRPRPPMVSVMAVLGHIFGTNFDRGFQPETWIFHVQFPPKKWPVAAMIFGLRLRWCFSVAEANNRWLHHPSVLISLRHAITISRSRFNHSYVLPFLTNRLPLIPCKLVRPIPALPLCSRQGCKANADGEERWMVFLRYPEMKNVKPLPWSLGESSSTMNKQPVNLKGEIFETIHSHWCWGQFLGLARRQGVPQKLHQIMSWEHFYHGRLGSTLWNTTQQEDHVWMRKGKPLVGTRLCELAAVPVLGWEQGIAQQWI